MSLSSEIGKVHNELYKTVNGNIRALFPLVLTLLDKFKSKMRLGVAEPIEEAAKDFKRTTKQGIDATLMRIQTEHPEISPLLRKTIEAHLTEISAQPESRINHMVDYISKSKGFLKGLNREDFIGILYETMARTSGEFDKKDGRFFTPKNIILINVEIMRSLLEKDKNINLFPLNVCDPCCGSARFLIYWVESVKRYYKEKGIIPSKKLKNKSQDIYARNLYGIDIAKEIAGYACWNMLFHGDGATNIANADSLNHFGILGHWNLIQDFINEFEVKFKETKRRIQQRRLQDKLDLVESKKSSILYFKNKNEVDISSQKVADLIRSINTLLEIHSEVDLSWWLTVQNLYKLKDFDSINEIMKFQWSKINEEIKNGFDLIITNPPFGRGKNLQINNPHILGQYKLATEAWIGDLTKTLLERLITKQFGMRVEDVYFQCLCELGKLNQRDRSRLTKTRIKKIANEILFEGEGNKKIIGEYLTSKITSKLEREWIKIEDVFNYEHKLTLKDSDTGEEHTIYYDEEGKPLLFKKQLPKQVLFLEQFLRMLKNGGKVFTVIDTGVLSNNDDEYVRRFLFRNSRVHAIVEFPHNAFKAAGTGVKTAIILYEKMPNPLDDYKIFGSLPLKLGYVLNKKDTPPDPDNNDLGKTLSDYREFIGLNKICNRDEWKKEGHCSYWRKYIEKVEET
ncbi:MAG: SAM-dependent DNA methyltransferase [Candidatus Helarchaeota archaeon]|nr:SAM-dependent DNA methyltransferase [Candidatus Helarchaeota archaeon]